MTKDNSKEKRYHIEDGIKRCISFRKEIEKVSSVLMAITIQSIMNKYKAVYRKAERKVYMLGKLRFFVDKVTTLLTYKQAVLPYFDYGGFLLVSCNQGQKKDL